MRESNRSPLSIGQVQLAKRYEPVLTAINEEFPEQFKSRELSSKFPDIGHGDLLKLKKHGLIDNQHVGTDSAKDWFLTRSAERWLNSRSDE